MKIREALSIQGTTKLGILCYGVFDASALDGVIVELNQKIGISDSEIHTLIDEEWPNALLLNEITVPSDSDIMSLVSQAFGQMFGTASCKAAVCMYDGAFASYEDIFGPDAASQTYAFCLPGEEPVLAADAEAMESEAWLSAMAKAHGRLS